jgi:hypothetical protein
MFIGLFRTILEAKGIGEEGLPYIRISELQYRSKGIMIHDIRLGNGDLVGAIVLWRTNCFLRGYQDLLRQCILRILISSFQVE